MMLLSTVAQHTQGTLIGRSDVMCSGVSTDTRTLKSGDLFVALKGPHFDGHAFLAEAIAKGAVAALIETPLALNIPCVHVNDTKVALGKLAAAYRLQFSLPLIALTGSCGKTTTRALIASILSQCGPTLFSKNSYNNAIGLPLTLLDLRASHQYAVVEMGANHFNEIAYLTHIANPTVALITNAGAAHLAGFGSVAGVCNAKGEIFQGLKANGVAILNQDDPHFNDWKVMSNSFRQLCFSRSNIADIYTLSYQLTSAGTSIFQLITPLGDTLIQLPLLGQHNIHNALAAASVAYAVGASLSAIKAGLENIIPVSKRLNLYTLSNGTTIIDDSYNANPLSVKAAIELLAQRVGHKILVLSDMAELGAHAETEHQKIGKIAYQAGIDQLYTYGELSQLTTEAFGNNAQHYSDQQPLIQALKKDLTPTTTLLVKGSRVFQMERIVEAVKENNH